MVETTPSEAGHPTSATFLEVSDEGQDGQELSPAERQKNEKIMRDILSLPSSWTDAEESKSSHRGNTLDHLDLVYTLGSVYFTFQIYRLVSSQGPQTEGRTSQERPTIRTVVRSTPEQWEIHKKLLKQFDHEYSLTKCKLRDLNDGQMWDFYWVLQETRSIPKRVACFWAAPANLQREAGLDL